MEIASIFSAEPERQCRTCGEELPATFFPETGAQYHSCKSEYERQWRAGKEQRQPPAEKECTRCIQLLPSTDYLAEKGNSSGLGSYCRACVRERNEESYAL